jgi:hypothetical protein
MPDYVQSFSFLAQYNDTKDANETKIWVTGYGHCGKALVYELHHILVESLRTVQLRKCPTSRLNSLIT